MPNKSYQEANYINYTRPPCALEPQNAPQYVSYAMPVMPNSAYNTQVSCGHQNLQRGQPSYSQNPANGYADHVDTNWLNDPRMLSEIEKGLKLSDKIDAVEITSKDLSPASFCSNLDLLLPDFYKNMGKDVHYGKTQDGGQWLYNSNYCQKYNEYPSCAQFNCEGIAEKTVKYCSIQKQNELNVNNFNYGDVNSQYVHQYSKSSNDYGSYSQFEDVQDINTVNIDLQHDEFYAQNQLLYTNNLQCPPLQNVDQQTEGSNNESDIIVEESEEEATDCSEDLERRIDYTTCVVCNTVYNAISNQFYVLTGNAPLTMSSQKPVYNKLMEITGPLPNKCAYLCSQCLGLINTIDHLQFKLDSCKCELFNKFTTVRGNSANDIKDKNAAATKSDEVIKKRSLKDLCRHSFNCRTCKRGFSLRKFYLFHMTRHKFKNRYLCEMCGKRFSKLFKFKVHLKSHSKVIRKVVKINAYLCKICHKHFRTKSNLQEHENYCSGRLPYKCKNSTCNKKFASSTKLKCHVKLKHDKKFTSICSICNIGFVKSSNYKSHMISHSTDKKYSCPKCDKSYKTLSNLNFHIKFHNEKLPFVCEICNKGFMRKDYLESHINLHKGIKNYGCHMCDKKFVSQKNLDAHLKYHEGNVKRKSCNICSKLITTGLEDHIRTHNNLKEFGCDRCNMKFNTKSALSKHKKRKHSEIIVNKNVVE